MRLTGLWTIYKMEMWDEAYMNMETEAYIRFHEDGSGEFQFGLVKGQMDGEVKKMGDDFRYEFSWDGFDESDHVSGRGWAAQLDTGIIEGEIRFHFGDHSNFWACAV